MSSSSSPYTDWLHHCVSSPPVTVGCVRSGVIWLPSHHPGECCTLVVVEETPPPPPPPFYVKRFEYPEKRYINVTNYYYYFNIHIYWSLINALFVHQSICSAFNWWKISWVQYNANSWLNYCWLNQVNIFSLYLDKSEHSLRSFLKLSIHTLHLSHRCLCEAIMRYQRDLMVSMIVPYRVKTKQHISMISCEHHLGHACLFISTYICKKMRV